MRYPRRLSALSKTAIVSALTVLSIAPGTAWATPVNASSNASGEEVSLTLAPVVGTTAQIDSLLPYASGSGAQSYDFSNSLISASVGGVLQTGLLNVDASATLSPASAMANAASTVDGLNVGLLNGLLNVLGISATTIQSTAAISGTPGGLSPLGSTTIEGLSVAGLAPFGAMIVPGVNDVILNALGIKITLNQQTLTGGAGGPESLAVHGIDVSFDNVLATIGGETGLLNGSVDIANSFASLDGAPTTVPEPASLALLGVAALGLCSAARWPRKAGQAHEG